MADWNEIFGDQLVSKAGLKDTNELLSGKKIIGLYFSAHWCPPCRQFTPVLSTVYEDMIDEYDDFELIFVSSDRDEKGFKEYFDAMPFLALPFENRAAKDELAKAYGVSGIPMLIFLNADGKIISADGRSVVANSNGDVDLIRDALL